MTRHTVVALFCCLLSAATLLADEMEVLRSRYLQARPGSVRAVTEPGAKLPLRLFDDVQLEATLDHVESDALNGFVWRGHIAEIPGSWVVLVESNGCLSGTIAGPDSLYRIRCLGTGMHAIDEVAIFEPTLDDAEVPSWFASSAFEVAQDSSALEEDEIVEMDLMVVFTRQAARQLVREFDTGETNAKRAMKSEIKLAVAITNAILQNSGVNIRFRLVKARPVRYETKGISSLDLNALAGTSDGDIDQIHGWRDRFGADFVSMILEEMENGVGGRGYQVPPGFTETEELMFNVVRWDLLWWVALAHELGHNMGLAHDKANDTTIPESKSYRYSRGYRDPQGGFRTVMAYKKGCQRCTWMLPHFSNKEITWQGAPTGSPGFQPTCGDGTSTGPKCGRKTGSNKANSARSLNQSRAFYAGVRACQKSCSE